MTTQSSKSSGSMSGGKADQVVLEWLKQPGNYDRFMNANAVAKRRGRAIETKPEVAASVCNLLQDAGIHGCTPHAISIKLSIWTKQFMRAQAVAASGASKNKVKRAFTYYYDLVDHLPGSVFGMSGQGGNIILQETNSSTQQSGSTRVTMLHFQMMNQLLQKQQQILEQQAHRDRLQELELQATLIERMAETGFTKEEIGEHLEKLQDNYKRRGTENTISE